MQEEYRQSLLLRNASSRDISLPEQEER